MLEKGMIHYDEDGLPRCHVCGKSYKKVLTHVWQKHQMSAVEYKKEFGLDIHKGIVCKETKEKLQKAIKENYKVVVEKNLIHKGKHRRFKKGSPGRTRDKVSLQTRNRLIENFTK